MNGLFLFSVCQFQPNGLVAIIGQRWRVLDKEARTVWEGSTELAKSRKPEVCATTPKTVRSALSKTGLHSPKCQNRKEKLTSYQLFFRETAKALKEDGQLKQKEIVKAIGERWRALTPEELATLVSRAATMTAEMAAASALALQTELAKHPPAVKPELAPVDTHAVDVSLVPAEPDANGADSREILGALKAAVTQI